MAQPLQPLLLLHLRQAQLWLHQRLLRQLLLHLQFKKREALAASPLSGGGGKASSCSICR
jgi:hypothetical protein